MNKVEVVEKSNEGKVAVLMGCFLIFLILLGAVAVGFESGNVMSFTKCRGAKQFTWLPRNIFR